MPNGRGRFVSFPNLYPVLALDAGMPAAVPRGMPSETLAAQGIHEVVIEAPTHVTASVGLTDGQASMVLRAYREPDARDAGP